MRSRNAASLRPIVALLLLGAASQASASDVNGFLVATHSTCGGDQKEMEQCNTQICPAAPARDCEFAIWATWGECSCGGVQQRSRTIRIHEAHGGKQCMGAMAQVARCESPCHPPSDCRLSSWTDWGVCTQSCGGGQTTRRREISAEAVNGGKPCSATLKQTQTCNIEPCERSVDCLWGDWKAWGTCDKPCGPGAQSRSREIAVMPIGEGRLCLSQVKEMTRPCQLMECNLDADCVLGEWAAWSSCQGECDAGSFVSRARAIVTPPRGNGRSCDGDLKQSSACVLQSCQTKKSDCVFGAWSHWNHCSCDCHGHQLRRRGVRIPAANGGQQCEGAIEVSQPCNMDAPACAHELPKNVDCQLSPWSAWSQPPNGPDGACGKFHVKRSRSISVAAAGLGAPCSGDLVQMQSAEGKCSPGQIVAPTDCAWARWSAWGGCSRTCGGGEQSRTRNIAVLPENGGKLCEEGPAVEARGCNKEACLAPSCGWSAWTSWGSFGTQPSCGVGQMRRTRHAQAVNGALAWCVSHQEELSQQDFGPCEKTCEPVSCSFSGWSSWSGCGCSGVVSRHRVVQRYAACDGKQCDGSDIETKQCHPDCWDTPKKDCRHSEWSAWSACDATCGDASQYRVRTVTQHSSGDGLPCYGEGDEAKEERACRLDACPKKVDCVYAQWQPWNTCSATCGGGHHERRRTVLSLAQAGGLACKKSGIDETAPCNTEPCPVVGMYDCQLSQWSTWTRCSATCAGGWSSRDRSVAQHAAKGGAPCKGLMQDWQPCNLQECSLPAPVDCQFTPWSEWNSCSQDCSGVQTKHRAVASSAKHGGLECDGPLALTRPCNEAAPACGSASGDCQFSLWGAWSTCHISGAECGTGTQTRERSISQQAFGRTGKGCEGSTHGVQPCEFVCQRDIIDCVVGDWGTWSVCDSDCGGGQQERTRNINQEANKYGKACPTANLHQLRPCNTDVCTAIAICSWSPWASWSTPKAHCGTDVISRSRQRVLLDPTTRMEYTGAPEAVQDIGAACFNTKEINQDQFEPIELGACPAECAAVDCKFQEWQGWAACSCMGIRQRSRNVAVYARCGGGACQGSLRSAEPCHPRCKQAEDLDCRFSEWTLWSACPVSCGSGESSRFRTITRHTSGHGKLCPTEGGEEKRQCNPEACPVPQDCTYSPWQEWGSCPVTCGGAQTQRRRSIAVRESFGGKPCDEQSVAMIKPCGTYVCEKNDRDCMFSPWSAWSKCSATCGVSYQDKSRTIAQTSHNGGSECDGLLQDFRQCDFVLCEEPVDCQLYAWSEWSTCNNECNGSQERQRKVSPASHGGRSCGSSTSGDGTDLFLGESLRELRACNKDVAACHGENPVDCILGAWSSWEECSARCDGGQTTHTRAIAQAPLNGGRACSGVLSEVKACNTRGCHDPVNCLWGQWQQWGECSAPCSGGTQTRKRNLVNEASNGGKPCEAGQAAEISACNQAACAIHEKACVWAGWTAWSSPLERCGLASVTRQRTMQLVNLASVAVGVEHVVFSDGETGCTGHVKEQKPVDLGECSAKCQQVDCKFDNWQPWGACGCNGIMQRTRGVREYPYCGGAQCNDEMKQVVGCAPTCKQVADKDCRYSEWTEWSGCPASCGGGRSLRLRTVTQMSLGKGEPCDESDAVLKQVTDCNTEQCPAPVDCAYDSWSSWDQCTAHCGAGQQKRSRQVKNGPKNGGERCAATSISVTRPCFVDCARAEQDCKLSQWAPWSSCTVSCGKGLKQRSRDIVQTPSTGGAKCDGYLQEHDECSEQPCTDAVDGVFAAWGEWEACSCKCNGVQSRQRDVAQSPSRGGMLLNGPLQLTRPCNVGVAGCYPGGVDGQGNPRVIDCKLGAWSAWSDCSQNCLGGYRTRARRITDEPKWGGKMCAGTLKDMEACNDNPCAPPPLPCVWNQWSAWSACTANCNGGLRTRRRSIMQEPEKGGEVCAAYDSAEMVPCNEQTCAVGPVCELTQWTAWGACSDKCNGYQSRSRAMHLGGDPAASTCPGGEAETAPCGGSDPSCDLLCLDGLWQNWGEWGPCMCMGLRERSRGVSQVNNVCGKPLEGSAKEAMRCSPSCHPKVDAAWREWSPWSTCTVTCGGGQQLRHRQFADAQGRGSGLQGDLTQTQNCNQWACGRPVDCVWTRWSEYGQCSRSCDGLQRRSRHVHTQPSDGGKACGDKDSEEVIPCNEGRCDFKATDCQWKNWQAWSECTVSCGGGMMKRSRTFKAATHGGQPCSGDASQFAPCASASCNPTPKSCQLQRWSEWGSCSCDCNGITIRERSIGVFAELEGTPCQGDLRQVTACNVPDTASGALCPHPKDCVLSSWGSWAECTRSCGGGQRFRDRTIRQQPQHGGTMCESQLSEVEPCSPQLCFQPVDCTLKPWSEWSGCSVECGGGQRQRTREVGQMAEHNGKECPAGAEAQTDACNMHLCQEQRFCSWSTWAEWGSCSAPCGGGERGRDRSLHFSSNAQPAELDLAENSVEVLRLRVHELRSRLANAETHEWGMLVGCAAMVSAILAGLALRRRGGSRASPVMVSRSVRPDTYASLLNDQGLVDAEDAPAVE